MKPFWKRFKTALSAQRWPILTPAEADKLELARNRRFLQAIFDRR